MTTLTRDEIIVCLQKLNVVGITVYQQEGIRQACDHLLKDWQDAECFRYLQNLPIERAQAYFWNYASRRQRKLHILAAIISQHGQLESINDPVTSPTEMSGTTVTKGDSGNNAGSSPAGASDMPKAPT